MNDEMLRSVEPYEFTLSESTKIQVRIEETALRKITISSDNETKAVNIYSLLLILERLLQIFDGTFVTLKDIIICGAEDDNKYKELALQFKAQRLRYFSSTKVATVKYDRLLNYEDVLTEDLFKKWQILLVDLGVVNQMYLYATSDCGFTNDVKCAFLVELTESLMEIIGEENIQVQQLSGEKGNLKICLRTIITNYGQTLFDDDSCNIRTTFL